MSSLRDPVTIRHLNLETRTLPMGFLKTTIFLAICQPVRLPYLGTNLKSEIAISSLP